MKGIINNKRKLYFARHAESFGNIGKSCVDAPLTDTGIEQAKNLNGHFDCVIVSPLRRTKETLHYSNITYDFLQINENFRERIFATHDCLLLESMKEENDDEFNNRTRVFHKELEMLCEKYENILLIGHAYYFNSWFRQGCFPSPNHAVIIELI